MPTCLDVLLPLPLPPLRWTVPWTVAEDGSGAPAPAVIGARAVVPWRGGPRVGVVTAVGDASEADGLTLKEALALLDAQPFLPPATTAWLLTEAERTLAPPGAVLNALHLPGLRPRLRHEVRVLAGEAQDGWQPASHWPAQRLQELRDAHLLLERITVERPTDTVLAPATSTDDPRLAGDRRAPQRQALAVLAAQGSVASGAALARAAGVGDGTVRSLVRNGFAHYREVPAVPPALPPDPEPRPWPADAAAWVANPPANAETLRCIEGGNRATRLAALLPGLRADLARGRSPLLLAPERILSEEAAALLAAAVPLRPLPADLSDAQRERWDQEVRDGPPHVLIGTWPLLASPVQAPGRLVVLEGEAESHKLRTGPRSWIPRAARGWAEAHGVPLVATDALVGPELDATLGRDAAKVTLPRPPLRWVASDLGATHSWPLSEDAIRVLKQVRDRDRQAVVLVPRRGFSAALGCRDCGAVVPCPNCDLALRWHARDRRLRCHQCGFDRAPPEACESCGGHELQAQRAAGSEWVLRALTQALPDLPRFRFDGDVREDVTPLLRGEAGVVVGTTAVLRLPPLPVLSLALVTQIDGALHADDFRADERALRTLLTLHDLVPGDAPRAPLGLIQTFAPDHPVVQALAQGTRQAVAAALDAMTERRRAFGYPPFQRLARVQISAKREADAWEAARTLSERLRLAGVPDVDLLGPAPAPVARIRGRSLVHLLLRAHSDAELRERLPAGVDRDLGPVQVRTDVDPRDVGEVLE